MLLFVLRLSEPVTSQVKVGRFRLARRSRPPGGAEGWFDLKKRRHRCIGSLGKYFASSELFKVRYLGCSQSGSGKKQDTVCSYLLPSHFTQMTNKIPTQSGCTIGCYTLYRVTHHVVLKVLLTSKHKFHFRALSLPL